jgi:hypothetical protein
LLADPKLQSGEGKERSDAEYDVGAHSRFYQKSKATHQEY